MKLNLYANLAACQLKNRNFHNAISNCERALQMDSRHQKSIYRRACANIGLARFDDALVDLNGILADHPDDKVAGAKIVEIDRLMKQGQSSDALKSNLKRMFI